MRVLGTLLHVFTSAQCVWPLAESRAEASRRCWIAGHKLVIWPDPFGAARMLRSRPDMRTLRSERTGQYAASTRTLVFELAWEQVVTAPC